MSEKISISSEDLQKTKGVAERGELEIRKGDGLTHALLRSIRGNVGDTSTASMRDAYLKLSMDSRKNLLKLAAELSSEEGKIYYSPEKGLKKYQAGDLEVDAQSIIKESGSVRIKAEPQEEVAIPKEKIGVNPSGASVDARDRMVLRQRIRSNGHLEVLNKVTEKPIILDNGQALSKGGYFYSGSDIDNIDYALLPEKGSNNVRLFDKPVGDYRIVYYLEKNPGGGEMKLKGTVIVRKDDRLTQFPGDFFRTPFNPKPIFKKAP